MDVYDGLLVVDIEDPLIGLEKSEANVEVVLDVDEWNDCGESDRRVCCVFIGLRLGLRLTPELCMSDVKFCVVTVDVDCFIVGVFNILTSYMVISA